MNKKKASKFFLTIGNNIKRIRSERNVKQTTVAEICGIEKAHLSRIESGQGNPTIMTLFRISETLNVHITELLREAQE